MISAYNMPKRGRYLLVSGHHGWYIHYRLNIPILEPENWWLMTDDDYEDMRSHELVFTATSLEELNTLLKMERLMND